jgi:hypothetical protein
MSATTAALRSPSFVGQPPSRTPTLIASPSFTSPVAAAIQPAAAAPAPVPAVKLPAVPSPRIVELEEEIRQLKAENEKQVGLSWLLSQPTNPVCSRKHKWQSTASAGKSSKSLPSVNVPQKDNSRQQATSRFPKNKNPMPSPRTRRRWWPQTRPQPRLPDFLRRACCVRQKASSRPGDRLTEATVTQCVSQPRSLRHRAGSLGCGVGSLDQWALIHLRPRPTPILPTIVLRFFPFRDINIVNTTSSSSFPSLIICGTSTSTCRTFSFFSKNDISLQNRVDTSNVQNMASLTPDSSYRLSPFLVPLAFSPSLVSQCTYRACSYAYSHSHCDRIRDASHACICACDQPHRVRTLSGLGSGTCSPQLPIELVCGQLATVPRP